MSIRRISFAEGEYYHIYNRGNSKQKIFLDRKDFNHFLELVFVCNSERNINFRDLFQNSDTVFDFDRGETLVDIGAYCLMPNHFHILIKERKSGNISLFMQKLATAYAMYFNKRYNRSGSLFEGKFKSQHVNSDRYLKYIFSYIHLNPVKIIDSKWKEMGIKDKNEAYNFCKQYVYSSLCASDQERTEEYKRLLNMAVFPKYFMNASENETEIFEWLSFPRQDLGK